MQHVHFHSPRLSCNRHHCEIAFKSTTQGEDSRHVIVIPPRALLLYVSRSVPDSSLVAHHGSQHTSHASVEGFLLIGQRVRFLILHAILEGFFSIGRCDGQRAG